MYFSGLGMSWAAGVDLSSCRNVWLTRQNQIKPGWQRDTKGTKGGCDQTRRLHGMFCAFSVVAARSHVCCNGNILDTFWLLVFCVCVAENLRPLTTERIRAGRQTWKTGWKKPVPRLVDYWFHTKKIPASTKIDERLNKLKLSQHVPNMFQSLPVPLSEPPLAGTSTDEPGWSNSAHSCIAGRAKKILINHHITIGKTWNWMEKYHVFQLNLLRSCSH